MLSSAQTQETADRRQVLSKALIGAAVYLEIPKVKLARILGVSPATVSRLHADFYSLSPGKKEWEFAVLLVRLFRSLDAIVGGAAPDARAWLKSENRAFAGAKPFDLIDNTEGLVRVVTYLDACRGHV